MRDALAERGKAGEDRQALLDELLAVIADTTTADEDIGGVIRGERIGWARIRAAMAQAVPRTRSTRSDQPVHRGGAQPAALGAGR